MKLEMLGLVAILLCAGAGQTCGAIITVNPDAVAAGTVITNFFTDVTLSTRDGLAPGSNARDVTAEASPLAKSGSNIFAHDSGTTAWGNGAFEFLRADFVGGARQVWLDFAANGDEGDEHAQLLAFDNGGTLVDDISAHHVDANTFVTLSVSAPYIAYIAAYWDQPNRVSSGLLDNLRYEPAGSGHLPEPGSMVIWLMFGVLGLAIGRRRHKAA
ncbi:MAG: hypothetical protein JXM70_15740 [Pirellulales bacterium]|nr:hypothetical protein [Pirellulales bacterium]